jgi:hypothetical protein
MPLDRLKYEGSLEQCPKCSYSLVFPHTVKCRPRISEKEDKCFNEYIQRPLFECQNPKCKEITCRRCHEFHDIGKCPEDEETEEALTRYVQNAMDYALVRYCPYCNRFFFLFLFFMITIVLLLKMVGLIIWYV